MHQDGEASDAEIEEHEDVDDSGPDEGSCSCSSSDEGENGEARRSLAALADGSMQTEDGGLVLDRALNVSLTPEDQQPHGQRRPATCSNLSAAYAGLATVLLSQEQRLLVKGSLGSHGYDEDDRFLASEKELPRPGAPIALVGSAQPAAYLRPAGRDLHVVKLLGMNSGTLELLVTDFLSLPTRQPEMGEWCLVFGDGCILTPWHGVRGFCGPRLHYCSEPGNHHGYWHSVMFESSAQFAREAKSVPLPLKCLAALPMPPTGSTPAPLEAPVAPPQALPPLLESEAMVLAQAGLRSSMRSTQRLMVAQQRHQMHEEMSAVEAAEERCPEINGVLWHLCPEESRDQNQDVSGAAAAAVRAIQSSPVEGQLPYKFRRLRRTKV